jgi:hypothetical protein
MRGHLRIGAQEYLGNLVARCDQVVPIPTRSCINRAAHAIVVLQTSWPGLTGRDPSIGWTRGA